jgi:hypothetical protein
MACTLYGQVGIPPLQEPYNKCFATVGPEDQCSCLEDQIQSILGAPGLPQINWGGGCYLSYDYEVSNICPAYENGSSFN